MPHRLRIFAATLTLLLALGCQGLRVTRQHNDVQNVLVLIAQRDLLGSFDGLETTLTSNFAKLPSIQATYHRVNHLDTFRQTISQTAHRHGPLDALILAFHGTPNKLHFGEGSNLHQRNLQSVCAGLEQALQPDAPIILYSCLTGEGEDNFAADLAATLHRPVIAPTHFWLMQTAVAPAKRIGELHLDASGRLSVNTANFGLYYKPRHQSNRDRYLIAPKSMDALCLTDGFVRRPSRFRPLFQRHARNGTRIVR